MGVEEEEVDFWLGSGSSKFIDHELCIMSRIVYHSIATGQGSVGKYLDLEILYTVVTAYLDSSTVVWAPRAPSLKVDGR